MIRLKQSLKVYLLIVMFSLNFQYITGQNDSLDSTKKILKYNVAYTGELQFGILNEETRTPKNANLLQLETSLSTTRWWKNGLFEASFWSVARTTNEPIIEDYLTFSNIDAANHWLICNKLGYQHTVKNISLFIGIRNVNTDYFTSAYSSLFTNSSAGIYPSISLNCAAANYPLSAFGIHTEYKINRFEIKNSFYNNLAGVNNKVFFKFHFNPKRYGYVNFSQIRYADSESSYAAGMVIDKLPGLSAKHSLYALIEQPVYKIKEHSLGIIAQIGYAPQKHNYCRSYYGGGLIVSNLLRTGGQDKLGVIAFHANTQNNDETAIELTYKYYVTPSFCFQPAIHYIQNKNIKGMVGLIRAHYTFGN